MSDRTTVDLDPAIQQWANRGREHAQELPALGQPPGAVRREAALTLSNLLAREFTAPVPSGVRIDDFMIIGPKGPLPVRRYRPDDLATPAPTQLFLHGGGFIGGTITEELNDRLCAQRAVDAGIQILSLEYRLAPEHPYPASIEDAIDAVLELSSDPVWGVDTALLGIGGNSAGAAIAASVAIELRDRGNNLLCHQALEVVPASMSLVGESARLYGKGFGVDDAEDVARLYRGTAPVTAPISPLNTDDLSGLPPTLIMVAEFDPLRDSGLAYAERLREAGVAVTEYFGAGHVHGSVGLTAAMPSAREWQRFQSTELARAYSQLDANPEPR